MRTFTKINEANWTPAQFDVCFWDLMANKKVIGVTIHKPGICTSLWIYIFRKWDVFLSLIKPTIVFRGRQTYAKIIVGLISQTGKITTLLASVKSSSSSSFLVRVSPVWVSPIWVCQRQSTKLHSCPLNSMSPSLQMSQNRPLHIGRISPSHNSKLKRLLTVQAHQKITLLQWYTSMAPRISIRYIIHNMM